MLPTARGAIADPASLIGAPKGSMGGLPGMPGGAVPPSPIGGPGGGPNAAVGAGGQLPPYLLQQTATGLSSDLAGQVPADVQNLLEQQSAEYGVGSGTQGSQFQGYRGLRNLGLTSLDMRKHAEDLLAGQFTNPAEQSRIDLANKQFGEGTREFGITQAQRNKEFEAQQALEKQRFAAEQNRLQQQLQLQELQSLGLKYGGGGGAYGGALPDFGFGSQSHFNPATGMSDVY